MPEHTMTQCDFDLHQILGIRLINPSAAEIAAVGRQLGLQQTTLKRSPEITIRFVEKLPLTSAVTYLNMGESGFTQDAFLVLRSKHKAPARVQIPMEQIGQPSFEIVCEKGLPAVPLLIAIINFTALAKGALPLHASAFIYQGKGILTTGWSKGGKTEMLLGSMANGATYVGDEWVYIRADGKSMHGIPEPIRLWDWHLNSLPQYKARLSGGDMNRLKALQLALSVDKTLANTPGIKKIFSKMSGRLRPILKYQQHVDVAPAKLFKQDVQDLSAPLDKVFFVASHDSPDILVRPMDAQEIARRMVFSLQYEQRPFMSYYTAFRFAFPNKQNDLIEQSEAMQRERLLHLLDGKESYGVYHPYPVDIQSLFQAVCPFLERK